MVCFSSPRAQTFCSKAKTTKQKTKTVKMALCVGGLSRAPPVLMIPRGSQDSATSLLMAMSSPVKGQSTGGKGRSAWANLDDTRQKPPSPPPSPPGDCTGRLGPPATGGENTCEVLSWRDAQQVELLSLGCPKGSRRKAGVWRKPGCLNKQFRYSEPFLSGKGGTPPEIHVPRTQPGISLLASRLS